MIRTTEKQNLLFESISENVLNGNHREAKKQILGLTKKDLLALIDYCDYYSYNWISLEYLFNAL